jgi:hypothetical protein
MEREMEREIEIEQIKHDLDVLRTRYTGYQRTAKILRYAYMAFGIVLASVALALAVKLFAFDALYGAFYVAALLIVVPVLFWMIRAMDLRWIDLAAPRMRGIYHPDFFKPDAPRRRSRSDAEVTEQQISDYERRLSELSES